MTTTRRPVQVRPATAGDASAVADLAGELAQSFVFSRTAFDRTYPVLLASRDACVLLAVRGEQPVGYLFGVTHLTFYANGPVAVVEEILVRPQDRRHGVGRMLMTAFESWAVGLGCVQITLATRRAVPFYRSLRYEKTAVLLRKVLAVRPSPARADREQ